MNANYGQSMNKQPAAGHTSPEISEADVKAYLKNHPDFFRDNAALLGDLSLPHASGNTISLVEKQVAVLRERSIKTRRKLGELIDNAQENDTLFSKTQNLVLALLQLGNPEELLSTVEQAFVNQFEVEQCSIILLSDSNSIESVLESQRIKTLADGKSTLGHILENNGAFCGTLRDTESDFIFGAGELPGKTVSAAVTLRPLKENRIFNDGVLLIAVGHSDGNHYNSDTGTIFIDYISDVVQIQLNRLLS